MKPVDNKVQKIAIVASLLFHAIGFVGLEFLLQSKPQVQDEQFLSVTFETYQPSAMSSRKRQSVRFPKTQHALNKRELSSKKDSLHIVSLEEISKHTLEHKAGTAEYSTTTIGTTKEEFLIQLLDEHPELKHLVLRKLLSNQTQEVDPSANLKKSWLAITSEIKYTPSLELELRRNIELYGQKNNPLTPFRPDVEVDVISLFTYLVSAFKR